MWREIAGHAFPEVEFREPVSSVRLAEAEQRLGCSIPSELVSLLQGTDGIVPFRARTGGRPQPDR
jgi:hypothetical protein